MVGPAPEPFQSPEIPPATDYTMTIIGFGIAILAAIAVVGIVMVLLLRKRA
jgi:hypothetical protein